MPFFNKMRTKRGQTMGEYAVILATVGLVCVIGLTSVRTGIQDSLVWAINTMSTAMNAALANGQAQF